MPIKLHTHAFLKFFCLLLFTVTARSLQAGTIRVPADQPTIQAGINAAATGDTVLVSPGTYYENIDFKGKAITVTSSGGAAQTIIDGGGLNPAVAFTSREMRNSILSGFTIQHGGIPNLFYGNAGIYIVGSAPTILNNVLTHNLCSGIHISGSSPLIQSNNINNTENSTSYCSFADGYAIWVDGAMQSSSPIPPIILGNVIENNTQAGKQFGGGAGISIWGGNPVIQNNIIRNNRNYVTGGGIDVEAGGALISQNLIYANVAGGGGGGTGGAGGISFSISATNGPGAVTSFVINNTIVNNTFTNQFGILGHGDGSQIYIALLSSRIALVNNVIAGSSQAPLVVCDPTYESYFYQDIIFDHNDAHNLQGPLYGGTCTDKTGTFGNISSDPLFAGSSSNDFHLTATSPAIDAGNNSAWQLPAQDFDGKTRQTDFTGKGYPAIDIGAYEYAGHQDANPTLITLVPSAYSINTSSQPLTLSSQLISAAGIPTGVVTFSEDGNTIGMVVIDSSGRVSLSSVPLTLGVHSFLATYSGQGAFSPAISVVCYVIVNSYQQLGTVATTTVLTASPSSASFGQSINFSASVSGVTSASGSPTGSVIFQDGTTLLATRPLSPTSSTTADATFTINTLATGSHTITATYAPTQNFSPSTASLPQTINGTGTISKLAASPNPASFGQTINFTTTVTATSTISGPPSGVVTLTADGTTVLGTQTLTAINTTSSVASFSINSLSTGSHAVQASYNNTGAFVGSTDAITQTIQSLSTTTTLTAVTPNPSYVKQSISVTAHVASSGGGIPTGRVNFIFGGVLGQATLNVSGDATTILLLPLSIGTAGTYPVTASYQGDTNFGGSTSATVQQTVLINPTTISLAASPNPATQQQTVTLTATVQTSGSALIVGTVNFYDGVNLLSSINTDIRTPATITTKSLSIGTHTLTATFVPSLVFSGSTSSPLTVTITPQDFTLSATPSITLKAEHHTTIPIALASVGSFSGTVALSCSNLPIWTSCDFRPGSAILSANGTAGSSLYLDTDAVIGYARNDTRSRPGTLPAAPISLALLIPTALLLALRRRRLPVRLLLFALTTLATTLTLSGCSGLYPPHTPPGTYTITVTGTSGTMIHTANMTLNVTP